MHCEDYFDFVGPDAIRIKGHRIGIEHVLAYYRDGYSPEQIAQEFPGVSLEKIQATVTYYLRNRSEIDAYLLRLDRQGEEDYQRWAANSSSLVKRLREVKARKGQRSA